MTAVRVDGHGGPMPLGNVDAGPKPLGYRLETGRLGNPITTISSSASG